MFVVTCISDLDLMNNGRMQDFETKEDFVDFLHEIGQNGLCLVTDLTREYSQSVTIVNVTDDSTSYFDIDMPKEPFTPEEIFRAIVR